MFRRWVALLAVGALSALPVACGDRYGDPILAVPSAIDPDDAGVAGRDEPGAGTLAGAPSGGGGGAGGEDGYGGSTGGGSPPQGGSPSSSGPTGLCGACDKSSECGDANDACILHDGRTFCGRDCDEGTGCPAGYHCVQLDNSALLQCVPNGECPSPSATTPSLDEVRAYILDRINTERVQRDAPPLDSSRCLDALAQQSAIDYARTDEPLGKFDNECAPFLPDCACGWRAETEVAVADYDLEWSSAVELALDVSLDPLDPPSLAAFLDPEATDAGIGFWISGDEAWLAVSLR